MGLGPESLPALPRGILLMLSRRGFLLMTALVILLMVFTLSSSNFIPIPIPNPAAEILQSPNHTPENGIGNSYPPPPPPPPPPGDGLPHSQGSPADSRPDPSNQQVSDQAAPPRASPTLGEMPTLGTVLPQTLDQPARRLDPVCDNFPDTSNILLIMKTGATEAYDRLPTQFLTTLKCLPEYFVYSDMEQTVSGHHVRDSLDSVLEEAQTANPDFDLYRRQKQCAIDQDTCNKNYYSFHSGANQGWNLDKYKNIHIAEKTYAMRPNYDWYLTVDADTYVLWPTMVQWLRSIDPRQLHYLGSVTLLAGFPFAHGGSGYIMSQGAMREYAGKHKNIGNEYDVATKSVCCGDYMLGKSLKDKTGIDVKQMWPTINGEKPFTIPYGPTHWCHPIVTMHHMNSEEIADFWDFETSYYKNRHDIGHKPMLIKDIYHHFYESRLKAHRDHWDNMSDDRLLFDRSDPPASLEDRDLRKMPRVDRLLPAEQDAWHSADKCREACSANKDCYQWTFHDRLCALGWGWKLGEPKDEKDGGRWTSGWEVERIKAFIENEGECTEVHWPPAP